MSFRRLSRNAIAGVIQVICSACILFALYRFLLRELGPAQIGLWSLVVASASITRLAEFGLGGGIVKFIAGDLSAGRRDRAATTLGMATCAIAAVIGLVCILAMPVMSWVLTRIVSEPAALPNALALLPWALMSLWLATVANVFTGTLDACQRSSSRAMVYIVAATVQLAAAYIAVPRYGMLGMGFAQVVQALFTLFASLLLVRLALGLPFSEWWGIDKTRFAELIRYGGGLQLVVLGQLMFDPIVKAMMARFGGLAATGYFEMANRAITQFRAVVVAAYQALVPYLAAKAGSAGLTASQGRSAYVPAYQLLFVVVTPYFAILGMALPLLLTLWVSQFDAKLVLIGFLCLAGWYVNTVTVPAHMLFLAVGKLRWIIWPQVAIGTLNIALGFAGGIFLGSAGVAAGSMAALALGSLVVVLGLKLEYRIRFSELVPASSTALLATCVGGLAWTAKATSEWHDKDALPWALVMGTLVAATLCTGLFWRHPAARDLLSRLRMP